MKVITTILLILISIVNGFCQVYADTTVTFQNSDSSKRQVMNHAVPYELDQAVPIHSNSANKLIYTQIDSLDYQGDTIYAQLQLNPSQYWVGMQVIISTNFYPSDSVNLSLNGLQPIPITKNINKRLDSMDIEPNQIVRLVYDGQNFQYINFTFHCPNGFVKVNDNYCIEIDENPSVTIWDAILDCDTKHAKLCSPSDWYSACINSNLGLLNMTNNYEWVDHGKDHTSDAAVFGDGQCDDNFTQKTELWQIGNKTFYRCCYYR